MVPTKYEMLRFQCRHKHWQAMERAHGEPLKVCFDSSAVTSTGKHRRELTESLSEKAQCRHKHWQCFDSSAVTSTGKQGRELTESLSKTASIPVPSQALASNGENPWRASRKNPSAVTSTDNASIPVPLQALASNRESVCIEERVHSDSFA